MTFKNDQKEIALPTKANQLRSSVAFLPRFFRTEANRKFLQSTLDQLIQPGVAEKISGYVGRKNSKAYVASDNYINDVSKSRTDYQLEPAVIIKDNLENVIFYKDYNDYMNQLSAFGVDISNHDKINTQEMHTWNPHIDWDKFVNFREYYWLPNGPQPVPVRAKTKQVIKTYQVSLGETNGIAHYIFTPDGKTANPTLQLFRGETYRFEINTPGFPIAFAVSRTFTPGTALLVVGAEGIRGQGLYDANLYGNAYDQGNWIVEPSAGSLSLGNDQNFSTLYPDGITKFDTDGRELAVVYVEQGTIEFKIPDNAPDHLYYISKYDVNVSGLFNIFNIEESTEQLDVDAEIIGMKTYRSGNGVEFTNGLKIYFQGDVTPAAYKDSYWYVEGVGNRIVLVKERNLSIPAQYNAETQVPFDNQPFDSYPFSDATGFSATKDYLVINRASLDRNPWSRNNKWFHRTVIEYAASINQLPADLDQETRAKRPIIEFEAGLQLFNYGTYAKPDVDLVDNYTKDIFSTIEGSQGYNIDGIDIVDGMRILFTADTDRLVNGRVYQVKFIEINNRRQISLITVEDTEPLDLETVFVKLGKTYKGKTFYFENNSWRIAQEKLSVNQPPLFALCCPTGQLYSNQQVFDSTTFAGNKIFSYVVGTGSNDSELGFPLTYKNIENFGDIVFECNLLADKFSYQTGDLLIDVSTSTANLRKYSSRTEFTWENAWSREPTISRQKVLKQYVASISVNQSFEIDMFDNAAMLDDLKISIFVNNQLKKENVDYTFHKENNKLFVDFNKPLDNESVVLIKAVSSTSKNNNGWYEIPYNLERNPANSDIQYFTLGEVVDHVDTMIEDIPQFDGIFPGLSNLRDIADSYKYGKRFVKHTGPLNFAVYHITNKDFNIVKSIRNSKNEYSRFKRVFLETAENLGYDGPIKTHVDRVLAEINKDKLNTQPFYFSDMLAYGNAQIRSYRVLDSQAQFYPLTNKFDLDTLSDTSVLVYLNGNQLVYSKHYEFTSEGFVRVYADHLENDLIEIVEFATTDGSFIPPTPTKLGFYPKYEPAIIIDDTHVTDQADKTEAYKVYGQQDNTIREISGWFYPVYESKTAATLADTAAGGTGKAKVLSLIGLSRVLYIPETHGVFGSNDTTEYTEYPYGVAFVRGHDGSLIKAYKDFRDTLLVELEKRIFNNIKIKYNTELLDLHDFVGGYYRNTGFSKQLIDNLLINDFINWTRNIDVDYTVNNFYKRENSFTYNYSSMTSPNGNLLPGFWRAIYQQLFDTDRPHSHPWECLGFTIKPHWWNEVYGTAPYTLNNSILWNDIENGIIREPNKQIRVVSKYARPGISNYIPVDEKGNIKSPLDTAFASNFFFRNATQNFKFGDQSPVETAWRRSSEYPFALLTAWVLSNPAKVLGIGYDLSRIEKNLVGQKIYSATGKFITNNNLIFPNTHAENTKTLTSGLVNYIHNYVASNILEVYDEYKSNLNNITNRLGFKLAGFSEKDKIKLVLDSRSPRQSADGGVFVPYENYNLILNTSSPVDVVIYSGVVIEKVANGFLLRGYNQEKPYFNYYEPIITSTDSVITIGGISEVTVPWQPNKTYVKDQIVEYDFKFYRVKETFTSLQVFSNSNLIQILELPVVGGKRAIIRKTFNKNRTLRLNYGARLATSQDVVDFLLGYEKYLIDQGFKFERFNNNINKIEDWKLSVEEFLFWTTQSWAEGTTIVLSPAANQVEFSRNYTVVDDLYDRFYDYSILKSDGLPLEPTFNSIARNINEFGITLKENNEGIYHIRLPLVQKEHVVIIDNTTIFNDVIYEPTTGYRQERIFVSGYRSDNWQGSINIPGFVFDEVNIANWAAWKDYNIGSIIKHKQFYYVAKDNVVGSSAFNDDNWIRLNQKPESALLTNFEYRINQFNDFYDTESDYFDEEQQKLAQHLTGYQQRDYLQNLIKDQTSQYKFYQGFIREKGTKNSVLKLFNLLSDSQDQVEFYEDWAIQLGQYGSVDSYSQVEFEIDEKKIIEAPQVFEIVNDTTVSTDNVYRISTNEIYSKPPEFSNRFLPTVETNEEFVSTGGYVNEKDIAYIAQTIDNILNADSNQVSVNDYIWLINDESNGWNVLQHVDTDLVLTGVENVSTTSYDGRPQKEFYTSSWIKNKVVAGEYVAIRSAEQFGLFEFYRIDQVFSNKLLVSVPENNRITAANNVQLPISKLRSIRIKDPKKFKGSLEALYPLLPVHDRQFVVKFIILEDGQLIVDARDTAYNISASRNNLIVQLRNTADAYVKLIVDKIDIDSINNLNLLVQDKKYKNQKVWIDNFENNKWAVLRNQETFAQQQILQDPTVQLDVNNQYGKSVSVSADNNIMIVGDPAIDNGKVYYYKRNRDVANFVLGQAITLNNSDYFNIENSNFGNSVAVSEDGNFLAVGIPNASNIKTRFKGDFVEQSTYNKNDIVKYKEKLWKAVKNVEPSTVDTIFTPFATFGQLKNNNSLNLLVTGNPGLVGSNVNHILVRAPVESYFASAIGNNLFLKWNSRSFLNPSANYQPFAGEYEQIDSNFLSSAHPIVKKVEKILLLEFPELRPEVGDVVKTATGIGTVVYEYFEDNKLMLYIANINGVLSSNSLIQGTLITDNGALIGQYTELLNDLNNDLFGGWWFIETDEYTVTNNYVENGSGLVYVDIATENYNFYTNITDKTAANSSFISVLSYTGNPNGIITSVQSNKWVVRAPVNTQFPEEFSINLYRKNNQLDIAQYGLVESLFDRPIQKSTVDEWDGYIDYEISNIFPELFDAQGNPYEIDIDQDIIEVLQLNSLGNVISINRFNGKFYRRIADKVRVYVSYAPTNIGAWELKLTTTQIKVRRKRLNQVDRIVGIIFDATHSVILADQNIGKLLVFEHASNLLESSAPTKEMINEEYYFYTSVERQSVERISQIPSVNNLDYTQVYNVHADIHGTASTRINEGAVAVYRRLGSSDYILERILVSEYNRTQFGKQVKIAKQNNQYILFVSTAGNPGYIEMYYHGPTVGETYKGIWNSNSNYTTDDIVLYEGNYYQALRNIVAQSTNSLQSTEFWKNISWRVAKDKNYNGIFNSAHNYSTGSIVVHDGVYYQAATNIVAGNFNAVQWIAQSSAIEYAGYLPGPTQVENYEMFAEKFDTNATGDVLIVTNIDTTRQVKNVAVYRKSDNYFLVQLVSSFYSDESFGSAIAINRSGSVFAASEVSNDEIKTDQGKVYTYTFDGDRFVYTQTLSPPENELSEKFGYSLALNENFIAITSLNGNMKITSTFDKYVLPARDQMYINDSNSKLSTVETTFDKGFTQFSNNKIDSGSIYVFENVKDSFIYAENIYNDFTDLAYMGSANMMFGESLITNDNHIYAITINENSGNRRGKILDYKRDRNKKSWEIEQQIITPVSNKKIHEVFLYNKTSNTVLTYLDFIDPVQGKIAGPAEQEISYKIKFDPAQYTYNSNRVATGSTTTWSKEHVGEVWWKIDSAKFANAYQGTRQYQKTEWNKVLFGSVDILEWVESRYPPSEWDKLADTEAGIKQGISGKSFYGNTNYTEKFEYDPVSQTFTSLYYFWVRDKKTVPTIRKRKISIYEVKNLIENPRLQGYRFINFIDSNSFVLNNCDSLIKDKDVVLCVRYNTTKKDIQNIHTEYQIISDGLATSVPHEEIELKWINSLIGFDINKRPVPDPNLSIKDKYGIQSEPRQSMFVNRSEALKQAIERVNSVLITTPVVDNFNIKPLTAIDLAPTERSRKYDIVVEQIEELKFIKTSTLKPAIIQPIVVNGRITNVQIVDPGYGYKIAPLCEISGSGVNAEIEVSIDSNTGKVIAATVVNPGIGYNTDTVILVRNYSVLVLSDSTNFGKWAIYTWDHQQKIWSRVAVQAYDVQKFWNYVDWYATGYNAFTPIKRTIDGSYQLAQVNDRVGDIIKINNIGTGGWTLLEKISDTDSADYTLSYKTVGRQNGTIQFLDTLYDYSKNTIGFDNRSFDSFLFDNVPATELRIIFETIKNNIFVNELKVEYNQLFMSSLRYVLSEQMYVDWLFKTSFIRINHTAGSLDQDITFDADNLNDYEKYVEEVKPYSTTIREFVSTYNAVDNTNSFITDFDPKIEYDPETQRIQVPKIVVKEGKLYEVDLQNNEILTEKYVQDVGYSVVNINIADAGEGYRSAPTVNIVGDCTTPAKAIAYVGNGKITHIEVVDGGTGYISRPTVVLTNANSTRSAIASAEVGNANTKSTKISIKYDRISKKEEIQSLERIEILVGTGSQTVYNLQWPINLQRKNIRVFVNNLQLQRSEFAYNNVSNNLKSYSRLQGQVQFINPPAVGSTIRIEYLVAVDVLNAIDRINYYYRSRSGMPAVSVYNSVKDYSQLMLGIDYGGVQVTGLGFENKIGWNSDTWSTQWNTVSNNADATENFDQLLSGGNLLYTTATGLAPADIIVDGDTLVSPVSNPGPEELVPGQTYDSVNIKVFTRVNNESDQVLFAFSQFKDMLNRTHYKKYVEVAQLASNLNLTDQQIIVNDASQLPKPNKSKNIPGIIFINGERIEYFVKQNNTLSQLRRGTLGTGVKLVHQAGDVVVNQSTLTNIPYKDHFEQQVEIGDGNTTTFDLKFEKMVMNNSQQVFTQDEFEVFVAGVRLKKQSYQKFDQTQGKMDSPEGDIAAPAEFVINNHNSTITLLTAPANDQTITIVRKLGKKWEDPNRSLQDSNTDVSKFLKIS